MALGMPKHCLESEWPQCCLLPAAGLTRQEVVSAPFWDTFELKSSAPLEVVQQRAALNKEFALSDVTLRDPELGMDGAVESTQPALRRFGMGFR